MTTLPKSEHLGIEDFRRFQELLKHECGIFFHDDKRDYLGHILAERLQECGSRNFAEYHDLVTDSARGGREFPSFLNAVTVGETFFFRNPGQFEVLMKNILPELIARNQTTLNIWSAGCSKGDEPYSIAIALLETIPFPDEWDINLVATDINTDFLEAAKKGIYNEYHLREIPREYIGRYFERRGKDFAIVPKVKRLVRFVRHNLVRDPPPMANPDIIFCRNVIIYFDQSTIKEVIHRFFEALKEDGVLFLGHAETLLNAGDLFQTMEYPQCFIYKKSARVPVTPHRPFIEIPVVRQPSKPRHPEPKQPVDMNHAVTLANEGKYAEATREIGKVVREDNLNVAAHYLMGVLAWRMGDINEAESCFRKALYIDPQIELAYFNLGNICLFRQRYDRATREFRNALRVLQKKSPEELVRFSEDFTAGFLVTACEKGLMETAGKG